ncbi:MAG: hypothetical protein NZM02_00045, partial [Patescibacteria group bacterium]|nr:hypothetical protein [Patescibacteria group bacterium]
SRSKIIDFSKKELILSKEKEKIINNFLKNQKLDLNIAQSISLNDLILFFKKNINKNKKNYLVLKEALEIKRLIENNNLNQELSVHHLLIMMRKFFLS